MSKKYLFIVGGCLLTSLLFGCAYSNEHQIKAKDRTVEYGTNKSELINVADWLEEGEDATNVSMSIVGTTDQDLLEVGKYKVVLKDETNDSKGTCTLTVEDTTAPVWQKTTDTITLQVGQELKLEDYFEASDLSEVSYSTKDTIDTSKEGSNTILVLAQDVSKNKAEYSCTVNVVNETVATTTTTQEQSTPTSQSTSTSQQQESSSQQSTTTSQPTESSQQSSSSQQGTLTIQNGTEEVNIPIVYPDVCEAVPSGVYTDYAEANNAAQAALEAASIANGWSDSYYKVQYYWTNCGVPYYTFEYGPR